MIDANQRWDVAEAISWVSSLAEFRPLWIEEPTCPDDILGHAAISKVSERLRSFLPDVINRAAFAVSGFGSTGDRCGIRRAGRADFAPRCLDFIRFSQLIFYFIIQCHNRVMFKQFLQASALQFVQIDSCRLGSVNENLAVLLMAHKFQGRNLKA